MNLLPVRTAQIFCKVLEHDGGGHSVVAVKRERLQAKSLKRFGRKEPGRTTRNSDHLIAFTIIMRLNNCGHMTLTAFNPLILHPPPCSARADGMISYDAVSSAVACPLSWHFKVCKAGLLRDTAALLTMLWRGKIAVGPEKAADGVADSSTSVRAR
jgi:hypothetical protein